jgi:DNA modification methylase
MTATYTAFLASKRLIVPAAGVVVDPSLLHPALFPFQRDMTRWALRKGRAAIFADTGLGKTLMQLAWAQHAGPRVLILAPLGVARQTVREGERWGIPVRYCRDGRQAQDGITITNYEMLPHFDPAAFDAVVLDESSILKNFEGKTRAALIEAFRATPLRLCCTATPAPNDISELANHAEFLGILSRAEMLAAFFVHDDAGWRLKGHARDPFYRWLASWGMSLKRPSDLGYSDLGYDLPGLSIIPEIVETDYTPAGQLFPTVLKGVGERAEVRQATLVDRVWRAAELIALEPDEPYIAWCGLNDEGRYLADLLPDCSVLVEGTQSPEQKADALEAFAAGRVRVLITKPSIAGFGLNFQHCARQVFVGLSDSYEAYYQCIRRSYRFGQEREVAAHIVLTEPEEPIYTNVLRKEREAEATASALLQHVAAFEREEIGRVAESEFVYAADEARGDGWRLLLGDSAERLAEIPSASVDLAIFSPPFGSLYTYSSTERDLGNSRTDAEFWQHFDYIIGELLRVTRPGRLACVHVAQIPSQKARDGVIGLKDFRGDTIANFQTAGWIFHGEVCIDKDPQAQAIRTKSKGLLFTQMHKDSSWSRPALADYILVFRAPGENQTPIKPDITNNEWIEWARPIWYGIRESDTLNVVEARANDDERHICPLQLGTIERCIRLWSNRGETVLSPFAGIGSEGYEALLRGRRFVGLELKPEYWRVAAKNLRQAERLAHAPDLFSGLAEAAVAVP